MKAYLPASGVVASTFFETYLALRGAFLASFFSAFTSAFVSVFTDGFAAGALSAANETPPKYRSLQVIQ